MPTRASLAFVCATLTIVAATAAPARAQTTVLYFDSQPGDYIGQGEVRTFAPPEAVFTVTHSQGALDVRVQKPDLSYFWNLRFAAPYGQTALPPGLYASALRPSFASPFAALEVNGSGRGCSSLTGRFQVLELELGPGESVQKLAIDVEQHCDDATPALFVALRYNSTISSTTPFAGDYPRYELQIAPPNNGTVTAAGILCGGGNVDCSENIGAAAAVELIATPSAGFVFMGWGGSCRGGATTTVNINTVVSCSATFAPEIPVAPRSFLAIYSEPGDFRGQGRTDLFTPENSTWALGYPSTNPVRFDVVGRGDGRLAEWAIELSGPGASQLAPGDFGPTISSSHPLYPYLSLSGGRGCASSGRFRVLEAQYGATGTLLRLAVDIEQHCDNAAPGIFIALRYNSTLPGVVPFGAIPPGYELTITPTTGGRVIGASIDCGNGASVCSTQYSISTDVTLTAIPNAGFIFAGWTGFCTGEATTTVRINSIKTCAAIFQERTPATPRTLLFVDIPGGTQPRKYAYTTTNATFSVQRSGPNGISVFVRWLDSFILLDISVPLPGPITPGVYTSARLFPFAPLNGLSIFGCPQITGRFIVHEVEYGSDGSVTRLAADLEEHCQDEVPAAFAAIRYNSTFQPIPFFGVYPWYEMTLTPPTGGGIRGGPLNCGAGQTDCWVAFGDATHLTLQAVPEPGYVFAGWTGSCSGGQMITVHVNSAMTCAARFELDPTVVPRTVLWADSETGEPLGDGEPEIFNTLNGQWMAEIFGNGNDVVVQINGVQETSYAKWRLEFKAPNGQPLSSGTYENASKAAFSSTTPGLDVTVNHFSCGTVVGRFIVHEITRNPTTGQLTSLAIDFEERCTDATRPALTGRLRYNSTIPVILQNVSLDVDKTFPLKFGTAITWTASAHPGIGVEYSFWRQAPNGPWTMVQPYSTSRVYTWTPTASDVGAHSIQVLARRVGSSDSYEVYSGKSFAIDAGPIPTVTSLTADKAPQVGVAVTWTAAATGGIGPLQYQFWRLDSGGWVMARAYASSSQYTWTPTASDAGPHALQVWVRNAGSSNVYDAYRALSFDVPAPQPVSASSLTANIALPAPFGTPITWTAVASGGTAPLQYQFWRLSAGAWTIVQAFSSASTYTWTPAMTDAGEHALQVWVKSAGSTAIYDAWRGVNFTITGPPPVALTSVTTTSALPLQAGSAHTWTAVASGGVGPLQYQFWRRDVDGWKMARDWGTSPSYTWTPTAADLGAHDLQVWVRNAGTTSGFDAWLSAASFAVAAPAINVQLIANASFPLPSGIQVEWNAMASGGVAPLEYRFYRLDPDGWKMVQDYSNSPVYRWTPGVADVGTHAIQVFVRSAGSSNVYDAWAGSGVFIINP